ncbi:MAG: hypothetical protein UV83_C0008G0004 [candidate division WWE3 bacterium GW2011_GWE2_43_18]|nr:hypothetical protein P147_WWE3C00001G0633 [candidate division WWE3 bacterium RAAC2_WWE3_1]KKS29350.1 MAG: hypothetical protein UU91_C0006G0003 [candidate division WWE3 bacterium GW2011_GWB1_42_117]KKS54639.1 MAG: hypothetical protein UV21_C0005G0003 [candidate division WWE3 bacterium GW2011_GWD2_42_34]KKT04870.1 MAG: hypothetical protein UV83_C0008G0004 [candidate division WWE3 bacterium GW2011_GWE2_43_18]KKT06383.1 MAG: hypothetical protein UV84_C0008G0003 [candidate division WWE3 bacterium
MQKALLLSALILLTSHRAFASDWTAVSAPSNQMAVIEVTPEGIVAGEFDDRLWLNPYNGVYLSGDGGISWSKLGMQRKGVNVLKYKDHTLFAGAFYTTDTPGGLYISRYPYDEWKHAGLTYNVTSVDACGNYIYLGTRYLGLMVSPDNGINWAQKIGSGGIEGPEIMSLFCWDGSVLASTRTSVLLSRDYGETWKTLGEFTGSTIYSFTGNGNYIAASGTGYAGVFISGDGGNNWTRSEIRSLRTSRKVVFQGQYLYVVDGPEVLASRNRKNFENTSLSALSSIDVRDLETYKPSDFALMALTTSGKIFRKFVSDYVYSPLFDPPLDIQNDRELTERINAYFDHQYPLLAYTYLGEPDENNRTTLRYDGKDGAVPEIYYSSHSGIDLDAKYGDPVLASGSGTASYYYCKDCGNSIKIDHGNGLQTVYMHLQNNPLVQGNDTIRVNNGDEIGRVGLTGRTTGPHIHFETISDTDSDGLFSDEYPHGRTDPFGWNYSKSPDPWSEFSWNDVLGSHTGSYSRNLWKLLSPAKQTAPLVNNTRLTLGNKIVEIVDNAGKNFLQLTLRHASKPQRNFPSPASEYIRSTAFILDIADQLGNMSAENITVKIKLMVSPENLIGFIPETLKIYRWNGAAASWVETISSYDSASGLIEGVLDHFSYFAVFGEKYNPQSISTQINISPQPIDGAVDVFPTITFTGNGILTVYSIDGGYTWNDYGEPLLLDKQGVYDILYKSEGAEENWEKTKSFVLKVGAGIATNKIRVVGATFVTSTDNPSP